MQSAPFVAVGSLGGTIAMAPPEPGVAVQPQLDAHALLAAVPRLREVADVRATSLANVPSPSITPSHLVAALAFARGAVAQGAVGVVLTHGTDTLEETAYLLDLCWDRPEPIVLTGAMRSADQPSADGPANLMAAVVTARSAAARDLGVLVCLDDTVHAARHVTKTHATALSAFQSPGWGPIGWVVEGVLRVGMVPARRLPALAMPPADRPVRVALVEAVAVDDGWQLRGVVAQRPTAVVVAGHGVGHLSEEAAAVAIDAVASGVPVVLATRTGAGSTTAATYGYPGSEAHLLANGLVPAGFLSPRKARLLAHVLIETGVGPEGFRAEFARRGLWPRDDQARTIRPGRP